MTSVYVGVWYALAGFSTIMFLLWTVILPDFRVYLTTALAFAGYGIVALLSPDIMTVTETGATAPVPVSGAVTLFFGGLAITSGIAFVLDVWGVDLLEGERNGDRET